MAATERRLDIILGEWGSGSGYSSRTGQSAETFSDSSLLTSP